MPTHIFSDEESDTVIYLHFIEGLHAVDIVLLRFPPAANGGSRPRMKMEDFLTRSHKSKPKGRATTSSPSCNQTDYLTNNHIGEFEPTRS